MEFKGGSERKVKKWNNLPARRTHPRQDPDLNKVDRQVKYFVRLAQLNFGKAKCSGQFFRENKNWLELKYPQVSAINWNYIIKPDFPALFRITEELIRGNQDIQTARQKTSAQIQDQLGKLKAESDCDLARFLIEVKESVLQKAKPLPLRVQQLAQAKESV